MTDTNTSAPTARGGGAVQELARDKRRSLKMSPTPEDAFASPKSMSEVMAAVKPFIA